MVDAAMILGFPMFPGSFLHAEFIRYWQHPPMLNRWKRYCGIRWFSIKSLQQCNVTYIMDTGLFWQLKTISNIINTLSDLVRPKTAGGGGG
jgi:hypothetical protein